jgi:predicted negative regulator of RcsB-dependent stress response
MATELIHADTFWKSWAWVEKNRKPLMWVGGGVLGLGLVIGFVVTMHNQKEANAGEALSKIEVAQFRTPLDAAAAEGYLQVAAKYPRSAAGARALLLAAGNLFAAGNYEQARAQFDRFIRERRDPRLMGEAELGAAACLDALGKTNEAVTAYTALVDRRPGDHVLLSAKVALGRLLLAQGKPERAFTLLQDVERTSPYSILGSEAATLLDDLRTRYPNLAKPAVAAPAASTKPVLTPSKSGPGTATARTNPPAAPASKK